MKTGDLTVLLEILQTTNYISERRGRVDGVHLKRHGLKINKNLESIKSHKRKYT